MKAFTSIKGVALATAPRTLPFPQSPLIRTGPLKFGLKLAQHVPAWGTLQLAANGPSGVPVANRVIPETCQPLITLLHELGLRVDPYNREP